MGPDGLARLREAILELDPEGRHVQLDVSTGTVRYGDEIILHSAISTYVGEEEPARAYLVAWLCTKGGYLPANIELEKAYSIGRPKLGARLDILVNYPDGTPYALIEVKSPVEFGVDPDRFIEGQLFNIAPHEKGSRVLAYTTVRVSETASPVVLAIGFTDGDKYSTWVSNGRPAAAEFPVSYGDATHEHLVNGGGVDLRVDVGGAELERLRKRLHDVLWRGSTPDNDIYEHVVKLFLAKIYDEKTTNGGERYEFQRCYVGVQPETTLRTFQRINDLYKRGYARYLNPGEGGATSELDGRKFSPDQTAFVVELLQGISLTSTRGGDVLGGFFEGITRDGFKQSKGLFFTHANIAAFVIMALELDELAIEKITSNAHYDDRFPYIIDPSCGSGTFLLSAMHLITQRIEGERAAISRNEDVRELLRDKAPSEHANRWAKDFIFGIDDSELLSMATKVNMVLHRDGNTHVYQADGLSALDRFRDQRLKGRDPADAAVYSKKVAVAFDAVVSNPPFSITLVPATAATLASTFELAASANSENLFLERWYQLLKPGGRLGVVLPESFFATKENLNARLFLFNHFNVRAVVGLPRLAFEPWTPTKTSLLFAQKKSDAEELAWKNTRIRHEREIEVAKAAVASATRRFARDATASRPMGPKEGSELIATLRSSLSGLDLAPPDDTGELMAKLPALAKVSKAVNTTVLAVQRTARELDLDFLVISVSMIGYKRTKRTEYDRPNELFQAMAGRRRRRARVLNLNRTTADWSIETPRRGADALSILRRSRIWQ